MAEQSFDELEDNDMDDEFEDESASLDSQIHANDDGKFELRTLRQLRHLTVAQWLDCYRLSNLNTFLTQKDMADDIQVLCDLGANDIDELCSMVSKETTVTLSERLKFKSALKELVRKYETLQSRHRRKITGF